MSDYGQDPAILYEEAERLETVKAALDDLCKNHPAEAAALVFTYSSTILKQGDLLRHLKMGESRKFNELLRNGIARLRSSLRKAGFPTPPERPRRPRPHVGRA
jgi:hypothetical protein